MEMKRIGHTETFPVHSSKVEAAGVNTIGVLLPTFSKGDLSCRELENKRKSESRSIEGLRREVKVYLDSQLSVSARNLPS